MPTYQLADKGPALPAHTSGYAPFRYTLNAPNLITYGGLQTTAGATASLASTGFAIADVLRVFEVPAGFMVTIAGVRVTTVEGAAATAIMGCNSATQTHLLADDDNGIIESFSLNALATIITQVDADQAGSDLVEGLVFVTNGTVDLTFAGAACANAVVDIWLAGWQCW